MKSVKKPINRNAKSKQQHINKNEKPITSSKKMTNAERILFEDMNQIDWFPIDPYSD